MGECEVSEKASWRQEHHLKDEEALIKTAAKHKGAVLGIRKTSQRHQT